MKKILLLFLIVTFFKADAQQVKPGDKIQLAIGTLPNGDFKWVFIPQNDTINGETTYLGAAFTNLKLQVLRVYQAGNERTGYKTMLTVWADADSIPDIAIKQVKEMQEEYKTKQEEFKQNEASYIDIVKQSKEQELQDMKVRMNIFIPRILKARWIVDLDAAKTSGEIK